jgi:hypothetical protein
MSPIKFEQQNCTYAKDQPEYQQLPAHKSESGVVTTCWELTPDERDVFLQTGKIYLRMLTFNSPLQPVILTVENPLV